MKQLFFSAIIFFMVLQATAQDLSYYLPDDVTYNPAIPKPKDIIYHEVGEWHVTHDRLVNYMKAIAAAAPERVKLETMGFTYEDRPQVLLIITSPKNQQHLEEIRQQHLLLSDPSKSAAVNIEHMPIVVWIGHSIHGNEPSGANAALLSAYYLAAAQGKAIDDLLDNTVILFDPSFNPDGLQRFSTWANQHKSKNLVTDPNSREFNEVWPGGRFNHYWFDLNRDWLPAVHVESQNRLQWFHQWRPNILTDHHEQGSNATFFFQPGVSARVNPLTPEKNQELTSKLAKFHAKALDKIGSLYFTKESYDDFYYGKGSTYPDINGAIGILFEQASSRGHAQETVNGILRFPATIKNQFVTTLSTLEGANNLRKEFLDWQRTFYTTSLQQAATAPVQAYVFGDGADKNKTNLFVTMLLRHRIEIYAPKNDIIANGKTFKTGDAFIVPVQQPQYKLIKTFFEKTLNYKDSLFYDITAWTMPLAFGMPYGELSATQFNKNLLGKQLTEANQLTGIVNGGKSTYGYLLEWTDLLAPAALYELQKNNIITKTATEKFEMVLTTATKNFNPGTVLIPVNNQPLDADKLFFLLSDIAKKYALPFYALQTGNAISGVDMGSRKLVALTKPTIAMLAGAGVNATDAGEVWHLLDQRMNIPATHLEPAIFNRVDLNKYNTLVMVGGSYAELNKEKLKTWVSNGGTLILLEEAVQWASQNGINSVTLKKIKTGVDSTKRIAYGEEEEIDGAQQMSGAIFGADVDLTHPLAYGYTEKTISFFKSNKVFMEKSKNPFATPFYYKENPLQSGWISKENSDAMKNTAAVIVNTVGTGRIINIDNNPNFRAFWLGGTRLMMNAIFFAKIIDAASGRGDD
ncbi:MAG: zinc carboxypeptidase [Ferruginibacter sp.]|uniref:M14 metallopeptidase family protein n=1 Tax=Ferruginibacter sp. TaxID=1940288 RepID=UPI002658F342|nr:M14 metallopeptidase family protein [Ferruginibacter sp.]MDB5276504.1 zinc carboxypeptidase [Ferruginibacter sp.]